MQTLASVPQTASANPNEAQARAGPMILPTARPARPPTGARPNAQPGESAAQLRSLGIGSHVDTVA